MSQNRYTTIIQVKKNKYNGKTAYKISLKQK